ncbi:hypothetical protein GGH96_001757 [Coemansia sp. RSA 1972]|nr:hypothetical protein GGH96_001757 [Coemansia sp. RSA 1972]
MNAYLSATKYILLVAADQYLHTNAREQTQLAEFLVAHLYAPSTLTPCVLAQSASTIRVDNTMLRHILCSCMAEHLKSIDTLHVFIDTVRKLVGEQMDEESMLGVFARRCCLAFARMEFYMVGKFLDECRQALRVMRNESDVDPELPTLELELCVDHAISSLESHSPIPISTTRAVFAASSHLDSPSVRYLESLDFARRRESSRSSSSLRQFFDRHNGTAHYALLHLAALRAQLKMSNDARSALNEARHIARDTQDTRALLYIACWECKLLVEQNETSAEDAVRAFIESTKRTNDAELLATGYLVLCGLQLNEKAFETLVRVRALAAEHNTQRTASCLAHSRVWLRFNSPFLSLLFAQSARPLTEHELSQTHQLVMQCQLSLCGRFVSVASEFIDPVCTDSIRDTRDWLRIDKDTDAETADEWARRLQSARRLIMAGFVAEAHSVLDEIVYCPSPVPDRAILIAQQMLAYLD